MKFLIHYLAKTPIAPQHFNVILANPVTARDAKQLRGALANLLTRDNPPRVFDADDIVICNVMQIPDAPEQKQLEGS